MNVKIEEVSPELAKDWLGKSKGNRKLSDNYVLTLAVSMERGKWVPEASEVVFDDAGALIDGHHRLSAVETFGKPVRMAVKRGVPEGARNVIDTGRTRNMTDLLAMYRSVDHANVRRAGLNVCVDLLVGVGRSSHARPMLRTLDDYDAWMRQFREGIDWAIESTMRSGAAGVSTRSFCASPVFGAFAFAYKLNPQGVAQFHKLAILGESLKMGDPALALRNFVLTNYGSRPGRGERHDRRLATVKVLSAICAELNGQEVRKLQGNSTALPFFRAAYKGRTVDRIVEPYRPETEASPLNGAAHPE